MDGEERTIAGMDREILAGVALIAGALLIGCIMAARRERRRRAAAWHAYFREGGLVRSLMARWSRTPKLTDQRRRS